MYCIVRRRKEFIEDDYMIQRKGECFIPGCKNPSQTMYLCGDHLPCFRFNGDLCFTEFFDLIKQLKKHRRRIPYDIQTYYNQCIEFLNEHIETITNERDCECTNERDCECTNERDCECTNERDCECECNEHTNEVLAEETPSLDEIFTKPHSTVTIEQPPFIDYPEQEFSFNDFTIRCENGKTFITRHDSPRVVFETPTELFVYHECRDLDEYKSMILDAFKQLGEPDTSNDTTNGMNDTTNEVNDVKKLYKKLVIKFHPDKGGDINAFQKLSEYHEILTKEDTLKSSFDECNFLLLSKRKPIGAVQSIITECFDEMCKTLDDMEDTQTRLLYLLGTRKRKGILEIIYEYMNTESYDSMNSEYFF